MKKLKRLTFFAAVAIVLSSCAAVATPLAGAIYTDVKAPFAVTSNANSTKAGSAEATGILGLFATGDASIEAASTNGNISKIHHVDYHSTSILGIYSTFKVTVYGE